MKKMMPFALAIGLLALTGCSNKNEFQPPPPPKVSVQVPEVKDVTVYESYPGRLVASEEVDVTARVKGYLKTIDFTDGQRVEKGDLLFTIEEEEYQNNVNAAEAKVQQAEANLALANTTLERMKQAAKSDAVSKLDVLKAEAEFKGATGVLIEAQSALKQAKLDLSYTQIHAPLSGRAAKRTLSVGNLVGDGTATLLTTLVAQSPMDVFFNLDERALLPFLKNREGKVKVGGGIPPVKLELANGEVYDEEGTVNYFDPEIDPATGTLQARAVFANKNLGLAPGLYGKILIPNVHTNAMLIPERVIQRDMNGSYVLVVNDESKVESRYIERGPITDDMRIVTEGLAITDRVIVEGIQRARPGIPVTAGAVESAQPSAAAAK